MDPNLFIFSYGCILSANTLKFWSRVITYKYLSQDPFPSWFTNCLPQPREWMSGHKHINIGSDTHAQLSLSSLLPSGCQSFSCLRSELAQAVTPVGM